MNSHGVEELFTLQHPLGSFASMVTSRSGRCVDYNGFVVAMVLPSWVVPGSFFTWMTPAAIAPASGTRYRTSPVALSSTC